jgi:hypothetical protein
LFNHPKIKSICIDSEQKRELNAVVFDAMRVINILLYKEKKMHKSISNGDKHGPIRFESGIACHSFISPANQ